MVVLRSAFLVSVFVFSAGCSSDDGDDTDSTSGVQPIPTSTGNIPIGMPGSPTNPNGATRDGGIQTLTPVQVQAIEGAACAGWKAEVEAQPALIQLVIDVSGSMREEAPGTGNDTKWEVTRDALREAIGALPAETGVGALYYPNRETQASDTTREITNCVQVDQIIPMGVLGAGNSAKRNDLLSSLDEPRPRGSTPTHDAFKYAFDNGLTPSRLPGNRYMLLITDGAPTFALGCVGEGDTPVPTNPIVDEVKRARSAGTKTFIIGSPGSEESLDGGDARPWLSRAAMEGGTPQANCTENGPAFCHFDMTEEPDFGAALRDGLSQIAGQVVSCTYSLPTPPTGKTLNAEAVNVVLTGSSGTTELVLRDDTGDCSEGWQYANNQVVLCEDTCNRAKSDAGGRVALHFGCSSNSLPIE